MPASMLPPTGPALDRVIRRNTITLASALAIGWTIIGALAMAGLLTSASMAVLGPALLSVVNIGPLMLLAAVVAVLPAIALARGRPEMVTA